jgi:hypothetical protein
MASRYDFEQLKASLERVRKQLAMLEATASIKSDREIHKRLRKAKSEESVILEKLERWVNNRALYKLRFQTPDGRLFGRYCEVKSAQIAVVKSASCR